MQLSSKLGIVGGVLLTLSFIIPALAIPVSSFTWNEPTNYENGAVIDPADTLTYTIYCGASSGGPYQVVATGVSGNSVNNVDVGSCVNGTPGTYYFVATAYSTLYQSESIYSNEASRTYTVIDLGQVPNPPVLISVQ